MRASVSHCLLLLVVFVAIATPAPVALADPDRGDALGSAPVGASLNQRRLGNGLTVVVQEDHRTPLVSVVLRYDVGERAAPQGLHGIATLTQTLASTASAHVPAGDASRLLWRAGASFSEVTYSDFTVLSATLPAYRFALPLWLWSDQMGFFSETLDDTLFRAKRDELAERLRAGLESTPLAHLSSFADEELFPPGHPYHEALGTPESVARIGRAQVLEFHDRWMTPDHATLVVVGDIRAPEAFAEIERYFGPIPASTERSSVASPPVPKLAGETLVEVQAQVPTARIFVYWPTSRFMSTEDADLDVVAKLLSGRHRAFLYWELVTNQKVAVSVTAVQRSRNLASEFAISIEGAPGKTATELLAAFDTAMDALKARPIKQGDISHAVYDTIVDRAYALEAGAVRAGEYAKYQALAGTAEYFGHDLERYDHVTPSLATDALIRLLPRDRRVVLLVSPARSAALGGERHGRRTVPARQP